MRLLTAPAVLILLSAVATAQGQTTTAQVPNATKPEPTISDNSFLIEEAYNQEYGVVQHIQSFARLWESDDWAYSFTQEWPWNPAPKSQLSYTIVVTHAGAVPESGTGLGDVALNYRYQVLNRKKLAFAPRVSLLISTGDALLRRGTGGTGVQINLPLSATINDKWVTHWNLGTTLVPHADNGLDQSAPVYGYNFGQSFIYRPKNRFNVLFETVFFSTDQVIAPSQTQRSNTLLLNPGVRWAYNLKDGMQIVPGVAVPFGLGPSEGEKGVLLYLSIEHPFGRKKD